MKAQIFKICHAHWARIYIIDSGELSNILRKISHPLKYLDRDTSFTIYDCVNKNEITVYPSGIKGRTKQY